VAVYESKLTCHQPVILDLSDPSKTLVEAMVCEHDSPVYFYVLDKADGKV